MSAQPKGISGWVSLLVAAALWGAVFYAYTDVERRKNANLGIISGAKEGALREMTSTRLRGLMAESQSDREAMEAIVSTDIVAIVNAIESAGRAAGTELEISSATPEKSKEASNYVAGVTFTIQAKGSYEGVARLLTLLGTLPVPVRINQFDMVLEDGDVKQQAWRTNIRMHALTASKIDL